MSVAHLPMAGEPAVRSDVAPWLAKAFRPMFLLASCFAALGVPIWLAALTGHLRPGGAAGIMAWHAHEMVYGFATAVVAGFLLTAVERWTGRVTVRGWWLAGLVGLWLIGRVVMFHPTIAGSGWIDALELLFLPAVIIAVARAVVSARDRRNYGFVILLAALFLTDLAGHLTAHGWVEWGRRSPLVAIDVVLTMVVVVTGRVVPMFTANATGDRTLRRLPHWDHAAVLGMVAVLFLDAWGIQGWPLALVTMATAMAALIRTRHWGSLASRRDPLLWILHLGHTWLVVGLLLRAAAQWTPLVPEILAWHALTVGAIGCLTLGMMVRVTLGHTGRTLHASSSVTLAFASVAVAAMVRVFVPMVDPDRDLASVLVSGALWSLAFAIYAVKYLPALTTRRPDGAPG